MIVILTLAGGIFAPPVYAESLTELYINSAAGDYVGGGQTYFYDRSHIQTIYPLASDISSDGKIDSVVLFYVVPPLGPHPETAWQLVFYTYTIPDELKPGFYPDARLMANAPGHPGLAVTGFGRGCHQLTGSFTILESQVVPDVTNPGAYLINSFAANFEQRCEGSDASLTGHVYYNYTPSAAAVPEPATMLLLGTGLAGVGRVIRRKRRRSVTPKN